MEGVQCIVEGGREQDGTWFYGGLGSVSLMVGLSDLRSLFQHKLFYNSVILKDPSNTNHSMIQFYGSILHSILKIFHKHVVQGKSLTTPADIYQVVFTLC